MRGLRSNRATKAKTRVDRVRESKPEVEKGLAEVRSQCTARVYRSIASVDRALLIQGPLRGDAHAEAGLEWVP